MHNQLLFFSLFFPLITAVYSQARNCPPGQFFNLVTSQCDLCPPGTFRTNRFFEPKTRCNPCRPGTFNPNFGLVSGEVCRLCYTDTFSNERGAAKCKRCPPGTIANRGATQCLKCGPGFAASALTSFADLRNPSKCVPCRRGTYSDQPNNRVCNQCPNYMTSPKQSTSASDCKPCPLGREAFPGSNGCVRCSSGDFKPTTEGRCQRCPPGTIAAKEGSKSCIPCPPGTRQPGFRRDRCVPCPRGTITAAEGARFCRRIGFSCPSDFFETKAGNCMNCQVGYRYNVEKRTCDKCPPDMVSRGFLQKTCKKCSPGQRPNYNQGECICAEGEQFAQDGTCEKCPKGTFTNGDFIGFDGCIKCRLGFFADKRGSLNCKPCPRGRVASVEGASRCVRCPAGLMPNVPLFDVEEEEANGCVVVTTGCPVGWVRKEVGATTGPIFGCRRISCRVGTPKEDIGKVCLPCDPGEVLNEKGTSCKRCARDEVSDGGIITTCRKCKNGLRQDINDVSKCSCFEYGWGIQNGTCKPCPKGSFSTSSTELCSQCAPGSFGDSARLSGCSKCTRDTIANKSGARKCRECSDGTISNRARGGTKCVAA